MVSSDLGNHFTMCWSYVFSEVDFLLKHHQKALENYFGLSRREEWKVCLFTGLA